MIIKVLILNALLCGMYSPSFMANREAPCTPFVGINDPDRSIQLPSAPSAASSSSPQLSLPPPQQSINQPLSIPGLIPLNPISMQIKSPKKPKLEEVFLIQDPSGSIELPLTLTKKPDRLGTKSHSSLSRSNSPATRSRPSSREGTRDLSRSDSPTTQSIANSREEKRDLLNSYTATQSASQPQEESRSSRSSRKIRSNLGHHPSVDGPLFKRRSQSDLKKLEQSLSPQRESSGSKCCSAQ